MASSLSISKILKAVTEARAASPAPHLCVVGAGEDLARVVAILSAVAAAGAGQAGFAAGYRDGLLAAVGIAMVGAVIAMVAMPAVPDVT